MRIVNSYYEDGAIYTVTYVLSNKMKQIKKNPEVAVCGEWFAAHGIGENLGYVRDEKNAEIMSKLRAVFAEWYDNGHTDNVERQIAIGSKSTLKFPQKLEIPQYVFSTTC